MGYGYWMRTNNNKNYEVAYLEYNITLAYTNHAITIISLWFLKQQG